MANALYDRGRNRFARAQIDWVANDIRAVLVDTGGYTVNLSTHEFLASIPAAARVATQGLLNKTTPGDLGVVDADDTTYAGVPGTSPTVEAIVLYRHVTGDADSPLIAYLDSVTGLPLQPSGADILIRWSDLANRIFKL